MSPRAYVTQSPVTPARFSRHCVDEHPAIKAATVFVIHCDFVNDRMKFSLPPRRNSRIRISNRYGNEQKCPS